MEIKYLPKTRDDLEFDIERLIDYLYPWQIEHILEHWYNKESFLKETLQNPNSKIHNFIKNGLITEHHENGQLKHEAFYINDKIDGVSRGWFDNGQQEYEHFYDKGVRIDAWKNWYRSGKIQYIHPYNEKGELNGHLVFYYENGQIQSEEFLQNNIHKDGVSYFAWYENGNKKAQIEYLNDKIIKSKYWKINGEPE